MPWVRRHFGYCSRVTGTRSARASTGKCRSTELNGKAPGRPASRIPLDEVFAAFRSTDLQTAQGAVSPELQSLIRDLEEARQARIGNTTIADLMPK